MSGLLNADNSNLNKKSQIPIVKLEFGIFLLKIKRIYSTILEVVT